MNRNAAIDPARLRLAQAESDALLWRKGRVLLAKLHFGRALTEARRDRIWAPLGVPTWDAYLEKITLCDPKFGRECMRQYDDHLALYGPELPVLEPEPEAPPTVVLQVIAGQQQELFPEQVSASSIWRSEFDGLPHHHDG